MRFEKLMFKNTVKRLAKSQFDLKNCFFAFSNRNFLKTQFLNSSFFATWFKITILTAPLMKRKKK